MTEDNWQCNELVLKLPAWLDPFVEGWEQGFESVEARMQFAIELAGLNVRYSTGGPFGAAVFDVASRKLIAPGVNLVEPAHCSIAHAEMVAIALAQQTVGSYDLSEGGRTCELVTSTEPCAMCMGALVHARVQKLVFGAGDPKWGAAGSLYNYATDDRLNHRIAIVKDVCQDQCRSLMQNFFRSKRGSIP